MVVRKKIILNNRTAESWARVMLYIRGNEATIVSESYKDGYFLVRCDPDWAIEGYDVTVRLLDSRGVDKLRTMLREVSDDTMFKSWFEHEHPILLEIVALGDKAIDPLIEFVKECKAKEKTNFLPGVWYATIALSQITGDNPIKKKNAGRITGILSDWIEWSENRDKSLAEGGGNLTYWPGEDNEQN